MLFTLLQLFIVGKLFDKIRLKKTERQAIDEGLM